MERTTARHSPHHAAVPLVRMPAAKDSTTARLRLQERGDRWQRGTDILRFHCHHDEVARWPRRRVVRGRLDAEILQHRFAGGGECFTHGDLVGLNAAAQQAADERAAHVAATENRKSFSFCMSRIVRLYREPRVLTSARRTAQCRFAPRGSPRARPIPGPRLIPIESVSSVSPPHSRVAKQLMQLREPVTLASRVFLGRRQAHEPPQCQPRQLRDALPPGPHIRGLPRLPWTPLRRGSPGCRH